MPALVVLDTNALLLPFERRVSIHAEIERLLGPFQGLVPEACLQELARLASETKGSRRDRAKMALSFSARFEAVAGGPKAADTAALQLARDRRAHLFTNDLGLIKRARSEGVPVIRLKGLSHLMLDPAEEG